MCTMYQLAGIVGVVAVVARYALNIQTLGDLWLRAQEVDFEAGAHQNHASHSLTTLTCISHRDLDGVPPVPR